MGTGLDALTDALGGTPPPGFATLTAEQLRHLAAAIDDACEQQQRDLEAAAEAAMNNVPRLLRKPVERIIRR